MQEEIKYITKVEINKLWGYEDLNFVWNLNPDVNILAGDNGSGKSTVLNLIIGVLIQKTNKILTIVDSIVLHFDTSDKIIFTCDTDSFQNLRKKAKNDDRFVQMVNEIQQNTDVNISKSQKFRYGGYLNTEAVSKKLSLSIISTFEQPLRSVEIIEQLKEVGVKTELDLQLYFLENQYRDYQINIGKRAIEALQKGENNISKIDSKRMLFLDTIDALFRHTQKKIDRTKNEVSFIQRGEKEISPYQLSSGEKQMLIILLTALVQDEKHFIMIMDEPEISLHPDWQENLIDNIRKLNENVQIIIATHSPSIVINGWKDKVFEMSEIQTKN